MLVEPHDRTPLRATLRLAAVLVVLSVGVLATACREADPRHPREVAGVWVSERRLLPAPLDSLVSLGDTAVTVAALRGPARGSLYAREMRGRSVQQLSLGEYSGMLDRTLRLARTDTSLYRDTLVLRSDGTGRRREQEVVHRGGVDSLAVDSLAGYSRWEVLLDTASNAARLCLTEAGYGPRECHALRLLASGQLVLTSLQTADGIPIAYRRSR